MVIVCSPPCGPVVVVDGRLMESLSLQVVSNPMVLARNSTKCGNKAKYERQVA